MLDDLIWVYKSIDSTGNLCGGNRKDRLSTKDIIVVPFDGSLLLASEYIYDIYYYDDNFNMINRYVIRKCHSKSIFLFKNEKIRIFVASSNDIELTKIRWFKFVPHVPYFNIDLLSVSNINFIGDSIVAGVGGSSYSPEGVPFIELSDDSKLSRKENIQGFCYVNLMRRRLKRDFNINVKNRGCSKYTSALISYGIQQLVTDDDDIICLCIGTNDRLIKNDTIMNYIDRVLSIIAYIESIGKKAVILSPIPSSNEPELTVSYSLYQISCELKNLTDKLCIPYINLYELLSNKLKSENLTLQSILFDGLHPNDLGYYLIYLCLCEKIGLNRDSDSFFKEFNKTDLDENNFISLTLHRNDIVQFSPLSLNDADQVDVELDQKYFLKTQIGYYVLKDSSFAFNASNVSKIYVTKSLFDEYVLASSNLQELYNRYSYLYFSKIKKSNCFCNLLLPDLFNINYKLISENEFVDDIYEGTIMLPSNQILDISKDMFVSNLNLTKSSIMWKYSLFWIDVLISKYQKTHSKKLLNTIEIQLKYFLDWMDRKYEKVDFPNVPSADHSASLRTVVFSNYLNISERTNSELDNEVKNVLCQHILWMILLSQRIKNNHGLLMVQGLLSVLSIISQNFLYSKLCKHVGSAILDVWNNNFDSEYVCKENSISYFDFNVKLFSEIIKYVKNNKLAIEFSIIEERIPKAVDVLKQLVFQNSEVPPIGDSHVYKLKNLNSISSNNWYKESNIVCLKNDLRYFYIKCGFNSSAHKHVDEGSFVLRYKNSDIVIDSGMYNYDRTSNIRIYVESAFGHNMCFPCSLEGVLSPNYVKDFFKTGQIDNYFENDGTFIITCSYTLKNGFANRRKITQSDDCVIVVDEYDNPKLEVVWDRICLSCNTVFLYKNGDKYIFKNKNIYFSITILSEHVGEVSLCYGYSSEQEHSVNRNLVLQIKQKNKNKSVIKYIINYWENNDFCQFVTKSSSKLLTIADKSFINFEGKVDIWGSCVSRDIFKNNNDVVLNYIARQSIISSLQKFAYIDDSEIVNSSKFKLSMILSDINKTAYDKLSMNHASFILIDFVDERFPLLKYNSTYITKSNELCESFAKVNSYDSLDRTYNNGILMFNNIPVENYVAEFAKKIIKIYGNRIILHKVFLSDVYLNAKSELSYFDTNVIENNQKINRILSLYYEFMEKNIPNLYVVQATEYPAFENHKWGLSPMHFVEEYYREIMKQINEVVQNFSNNN